MTGSLQENKGYYYAVLNIKDENSKPKQKWISLKIQVKPGNKRKAEAAFRKVRDEYERKHGQVDSEEVLFCDYLKRWLEEDAKPRVEENTYEGYKSYIDTHIYPFFEKLNVTLADLNYRHLQQYYSEKGQTLSPSSLRRHHAVINQTLKRALKHDLIMNNPADKVTLPRVDKFEGTALTVEQGKQLLKAAEETNMEPVVFLAMRYGLRRSEIAGLRWDAIDLQKKTMTIRRTVVQYKTQIEKDRTKNKSSYRVLPLDGDTIKMFKKLSSKQKYEQRLLGKAYQKSDSICRWPDGRPMSCNYLTQAFKRLLEKNDLPNIRLHDLRHTCASLLVNAGCSMKEVSDLLGHADISTTMNIYAHLDIESKKGTVNQMSTLMSSK